MGRKKGTKLSSEQKEKAAESRLKKAEKINNAINAPVVKRNKDIPLVMAYGFGPDDTHPVPIFASEFNSYKGKAYKTLDKALLKFKESRNECSRNI